MAQDIMIKTNRMDNEISLPSIDMLQKNQMAEMLKELFDKKKIEMISELSGDEIKLITRIKVIAKIKNLQAWDNALDIFMSLLVSKKREGRKEIIQALGSINRKKNLGERIKEVFKPSNNMEM